VQAPTLLLVGSRDQEVLALNQAARRQMTADIAHELRTPLTAISLHAHVLNANGDHDAREAAARSLQQQAMHAGDILTQLLAFARAQRQGDGDLQPVCLAELLKRVVAQHAQAAHDSGHELSLDLPPDATQWHLQGRPLLLELAVRNLVDNALQHTPPGTQVEVSLSFSGGNWELAVSDQTDAQSGVPVAARPHTAGLGLGLLLVRRIASWHGAQLESGEAPAPWTSRHALVWPATALRRS
jgi:two-component system sensor histidine kinase QseC